MERDWFDIHKSSDLQLDSYIRMFSGGVPT